MEFNNHEKSFPWIQENKLSKIGAGEKWLKNIARKKRLKGFRWLEAKYESTASCGYLTKQNKSKTKP